LLDDPPLLDEPLLDELVLVEVLDPFDELDVEVETLPEDEEEVELDVEDDVDELTLPLDDDEVEDETSPEEDADEETLPDEPPLAEEVDEPPLAEEVEPPLVEVEPVDEITTLPPPPPPPPKPPKKPPPKPPPPTKPPPITAGALPPPPTNATSRCGGNGGGVPWVVTVTTAGVAVVVVRVITRQRVTIRPPWPVMRVIAAPRGHPRAAVTTRRLTTRLATTRFLATTCWRAWARSDTCIAPPPISAPPQAQAQSFARAIRTDIVVTCSLGRSSRRQGAWKLCHGRTVHYERLSSTALTIKNASISGIFAWAASMYWLMSFYDTVSAPGSAAEIVHRPLRPKPPCWPPKRASKEIRSLVAAPGRAYSRRGKGGPHGR
jgi:hypothetical protein